MHHELVVGEEVGADLLVFELFAFLHDSQRRDEFEDKFHVDRVADFTASMVHRYFDLYDAQQSKLVNSIRMTA